MEAEHVTLEIAGHPLEVVTLVGEEELSTLFRFDVTCAASSAQADTHAMMGASAKLTFRDGIGHERVVIGLVSEARIDFKGAATATLALVIRPEVYPQSIGRDCYVLHDVDVVDIARDVLSDFNGPVRYRVTRGYRKRDYCAQYREDDWSFLSRLLEEEGIYYWFDHDGGQTVLTFSDDSTSAPDLHGGAYVCFHYESGQRSPVELIEELGAGSAFGPSKFSVGSFDHNKPLLKVGGSHGGGAFEIYDAPGGGPAHPDDCVRRAEVLGQTAGSGAQPVAGKTTSVRLFPGRVVEVGEHPIARHDGRYLVTQVRYETTQRGGAVAGHATYRCTFRALRVSAPFRAAARTAPAKQAGLQTGIVVGTPGDEIHTDPGGRVRVQLHWDRRGARDHTAGRWMRIAQRNSADSMLVPRIGWNVGTFNEEGSVDSPRILSRLSDAEHMPPYSLPANKTRVVFKTATTPGGGSFNEIHFEDKKGDEEMFINASKDMTILVKDGRTETIERDATRSVGVNRSLTVADRFAENIGNDQTTFVGGNETIDVGKSANTNVVMDEAITIGGKRSITAGSHSIASKKTRTLNVGAALIDVTLGSIGAQSEGVQSTTVGGAIVRLALETITESAKASFQTIGGARLEFCKGKRSLGVSYACVQTVGGLMLLKTDATYAESAEKNLTYKVGGAIKADCPTMRIEAKKKIVLRCGSSTVTILPESVEISSDALDLTSAEHLEVKTKLIEHN